jgi:hypothetical protein
MASEKYQVVSEAEAQALEAEAWNQFYAEEIAARGLQPGDSLDVDGEGHPVYPPVTTGFLATAAMPGQQRILILDDRTQRLAGPVKDKLKGNGLGQLTAAARHILDPEGQPGAGPNNGAVAGAAMGAGLGAVVGAVMPDLGPELGAAAGAALGALAGRFVR